MTEKQEKAYILSETLFLVCLGGYLIYLSSCATTFNLAYPPYTEKLFLLSLTGLGGLRLILQMLFSTEKRRLIFMIAGALVTGAVWLMVYRNDGYYFLRLFSALTIACAGCDYRKAMKTFAVAVGLTVLTTVFCGLGDQITNLVYADQYRMRSSWGVIYPTDFSSVLIYLCVAAWIGWKNLPDWLFLIFGSVSLFIAHYVTDSNTSVYISLLFLLFVVLHMFLQHDAFRILGRFIDRAACFVFPVFGFAMIGFTWLYSRGNGFAYQIDRWSHSRLMNALNAYKVYGIKLFGSPLTQIGGGGSVVKRIDYNFVDCSYLLILLRYGAVTLALLTLLWVLMTYHAGKIGDRRLLLSLTLIAFHSVSEHHFTEVNYNLLLVLPFSVLFTSAAQKKTKEISERISDEVKPIRMLAAILTAAAVCILAYFYMPLLLSVFRTVCAVKGLDTYYFTRQRAIFLLVFVSFFALSIFLWIVYRNLICLLQHTSPKKGESISLIVCLVGIVSGILGVSVLFKQTKAEWQTVIDGDREAMGALQEAQDCTIFVAKIPELYKMEYDGISSSFYPIEDLSRIHNVAVITDSDFDSSVLSARGFLFTEISENHAVYTNSESAALALENVGYHMTGYYSKNKKADISAFRNMNGLRGWDDGGEFISLEKPLKHGPYLTLIGSNFDVSYEISHYSETEADSEYWNSLPSDTPVCTLRISREAGRFVVREQTLTRGQFDGDEIYTAVVSGSIPTAMDVEFLAFPSVEKTEFLLHSIRYQKMPSYDTHMVFDRSWHKTHEAYFNLDGTPLMLSGGYHAVEFGYDSDDNINYLHYYNDKGDTVCTNSGYAEIHRVFDNLHQVYQESYYDTESKPIINTSGFFEVVYTRNQTGDVTLISYYGTDGKLIMMSGGYAQLRRDYNNRRQIVRESYFDTEGNPAVLSGGYTAFLNEYTDGARLSLTTFIDLEGSILKMGSTNLHKYLQSLKGRNVSIFISVKDEASNSFTETLSNDLFELGIKTDLVGKYYCSFYAVVSPDGVKEELSADSAVSTMGSVLGHPYSISSAVWNVGNSSSIMIDDVEYSKNVRGLNIVVFDNETKMVIDSVGFDTYTRAMAMIR